MLPNIFALLKASSEVMVLLGNPPRAYRHGDAPDNIKQAYVTWFRSGGTPENTLSELPITDLQPVQVDCWAPTDAGVEALAVAVRNALEPHAHMTGTPIDGRDPATRNYRMTMQFDFWTKRD